MSMKKNNILIMIAALIMGMCGCINEDVKGVDLKVGDKLPDFEVMMSDGSVVTDESLKGSVSLVMFFHTTCPDCQKTLPVMQRIQDEYTSKGVEFAVVSRSEGREEIEAYWKENSLKMPYSAQEDRCVYEKFAKALIPRIYVNDKDGIIRFIFTDNPAPSYSDLKSAVEFSLFMVN